MRPFQPRLIRPRFYGAVVAAGGGVLCLSIYELMRQPVDSVWFVLVGLTLITGWSTLRMGIVPVSFSISDTFTIAGALLFGPAAGTVIAVLDALVMSLRIARANEQGMGVRVLFNVTATALAMWLSAHVFFAVAGTGPLAIRPGTIRDVVGPLALFAALYFVLNTGLVAIAVSHERREPIAAVWREHFAALWLTYFSGAAIAGILLLMMVARVVDVKTIALILPLLLILHVTYRRAIERMRDQVEQLTRIASYQAALRSTADGVILTDSAGRLTFMNPEAERLTEWSEGEAAGRPAADVVWLLDPATRERDDGTPPRDGATAREYILVRPDGTECPVEEMQARVRDHRGEIVGTIRTFRDISHRKAIDAERDALLGRERAARAAADTANRLKDEFLTTLSHELRTPATGILGWVRLLKTGRLDAEQRRRALDALERSAQAQAVLLDDLLDTSRIVRGTLRIELRPTDVREPLKSAIDTVAPAINAKGIDLRVDMAEVRLVNADSDRLRQVFWNLLVNAVKFSESGATIRVSLAQDGDDVRVEVSDAGHGIDPESLPFIFDRFRQADGSTTRSHSGMGLGLAIVRHLMESHGGTVTAASEGRGRGARFIVRLPTLISTPYSRRLDAAS